MVNLQQKDSLCVMKDVHPVVAGLARRHGLAYTRYADDLTFSGDFSRAMANQVRITASHIVESEGFTVNTEKIRLTGRGGRQTVTGMVVNQVLGLPRPERRLLRAMQHRLRLAPEDASTVVHRSFFQGKIAFLSMLNPAQAAKLAD